MYAVLEKPLSLCGMASPCRARSCRLYSFQIAIRRSSCTRRPPALHPQQQSTLVYPHNLATPYHNTGLAILRRARGSHATARAHLEGRGYALPAP